jgi:hypothetical protein
MQRKILSMLNDDRGMVLIMALILMGLLSALAGAYTMLVRADAVLSGGASRNREGFYAAEAGLNVGMAEFGNIFKNYGTPASSDYEENTTTVGDRTVYYDLSPVPGYDPCTSGSGPDCYTTIPAGEKFAGLKTIPYRYTVKSAAVNSEGNTEATLGAEFDVNNIPIFQFLAFYKNDLYIMPLDIMPLHGRIHTNGDLRLNSDALLSIGDLPPTMPYVQVSAAGKIYRGAIKYGANKCDANSVQIDKLEDKVAPSGDYDPQLLEPCNINSPVSKSTLNTFKGSILSDVDSIELPPVDIIERSSDGVFWEHADLRIVLRLDLAKASVSFSTLCPATTATPAAPNSPLLYPIEVQDANGTRNTTKTNSLWTFMCQRRGAIFYTDVPTNTSSPQTSTSYSPSFANNNRVYRRIGEDTNGDGSITNKDRNDDICPISKNNPAPAAGTKPSWAPTSCSWPYEIPGTGAGQSGSATDSGAIPNAPATSWYQDTDYRRGGFYNNRESKWMYLLNVNMRALIDWNEANGAPLFTPSDSTDYGLVIFLSVQGDHSNDAVNNYGVRVFDSADLNKTDGTFPPSATDPTGLTVVSDQAIYIEGNYNFKDKAPAAVIGDALNMLSQGWEVPITIGGVTRANDYKSSATLASGYRTVPAQDSPCGAGGCGSFSSVTTTSPNLAVYSAFIAGIGPSPSGEGNYDGGLENYPRFHESWTGRMLKITGAFVSLGTSQHAVNNWACGSGTSCNIYDPPQRPWDYDTDFNTVEKLPPLTPKITYVQQRMYTRFYQ